MNIPAQTDEIEDVHDRAPSLSTMKHFAAVYFETFRYLLRHAPRISADFGLLCAFPGCNYWPIFVRRMAFNPQLADHAARIVLQIPHTCELHSYFVGPKLGLGKINYVNALLI